jgi:hypothetical protein
LKELKKHHHYVWKEYLKPWTSENKICCRRKGKIFSTSLDNIAQERFFYKSSKLGPEEIKFLQFIIKNMIPNVGKSMNHILNLYNDISNSNDEYLIKCGIEDLHTIVENYGKNCLEKLQKGNIEFLEQDNYKHQLSLFLGVQYMRTKKMRENLNPAELKNKQIDLEKMSIILPFIYGEITGNWIYNTGEIKLIKNNTSSNFITSDQPIFNVRAPLNNTEELKEFELYYPISPNYAIYISKTDNGKVVNNSDDVLFYNQLVKSHSFEQIFAKNESDFT